MHSTSTKGIESALSRQPGVIADFPVIRMKAILGNGATMLSFVCHGFLNCWTLCRPLMNFNKQRSQVVSWNPLHKLISTPNKCISQATDLEIQIVVMEWLEILDESKREGGNGKPLCPGSIGTYSSLLVLVAKSLLKLFAPRCAESTTILLQDAGKL